MAADAATKAAPQRTKAIATTWSHAGAIGTTLRRQSAFTRVSRTLPDPGDCHRNAGDRTFRSPVASVSITRTAVVVGVVIATVVLRDRARGRAGGGGRRRVAGSALWGGRRRR